MIVLLRDQLKLLCSKETVDATELEIERLRQSNKPDSEVNQSKEQAKNNNLVPNAAMLWAETFPVHCHSPARKDCDTTNSNLPPTNAWENEPPLSEAQGSPFRKGQDDKEDYSIQSPPGNNK